MDSIRTNGARISNPATEAGARREDNLNSNWESQQPPSFFDSRVGFKILGWIGAGLIVLWIAWFGFCLVQKPLPRAMPTQVNYYRDRLTYFPVEPFIGLDFHHNYVAARQWQNGGDPYVSMVGDPANKQYVYPPFTLVAFGWTRYFAPGHRLVMNLGQTGSIFAPSESAILIWLSTIVAIIAYCAWLTGRNRSVSRLSPLPWPFIFGTALVSYPVLFEFERGNCDVLVLLAIAVIARALSWSKTKSADFVIGLCVAGATGIKPYAIVLLPGLIALRRYRAAASAAAALLLEVFLFLPDLRRWLILAEALNRAQAREYCDWSHSIIYHWQILWSDLGISALARLPAQATFGVLLVIVSALVAWPVFRRPSVAIAWPFLLWLTAAGTMLLPLANDYSLIFLPFAILAVWSVTDPWPLQLCVVLAVIICQPFFFGLTGLPLLLLKVGTMLLSSAFVVRRVSPPPPPGAVTNGELAQPEPIRVHP